MTRAQLKINLRQAECAQERRHLAKVNDIGAAITRTLEVRLDVELDDHEMEICEHFLLSEIQMEKMQIKWIVIGNSHLETARNVMKSDFLMIY